jgi:hypothetical protein
LLSHGSAAEYFIAEPNTAAVGIVGLRPSASHFSLTVTFSFLSHGSVYLLLCLHLVCFCLIYLFIHSFMHSFILINWVVLLCSKTMLFVYLFTPLLNLLVMTRK